MSRTWSGQDASDPGERPDEALFRATGLRKAYREKVVLDRFDLEADRGDILGVVGTNGVGKSTLLKGLAGATPLDDGVITIRGERSHPSSAEHWRSVFGILDDFAWLPDLTVADHLMLMATDPDDGRVRRALDRFGLGDLGDRLPDSLSSGQRQRAILATTRVRPWTVLLLDEPERHLDADGVRLLARELVSLVDGQDRCVVLASHSPTLVELLDCAVIDLSPVSGRDHR